MHDEFRSFASKLSIHHGHGERCTDGVAVSTRRHKTDAVVAVPDRFIARGIAIAVFDLQSDEDLRGTVALFLLQRSFATDEIAFVPIDPAVMPVWAAV